MDFTPKRVGETEIYTVDFINVLPAGVTIVSAIWTVIVKAGVDPNPNAMVLGPASIVGAKVSTKLTAGLAHVFYMPICTATCSDGEVIILPEPGSGMLAVVA